MKSGKFQLRQAPLKHFTTQPFSNTVLASDLPKSTNTWLSPLCAQAALARPCLLLSPHVHGSSALRMIILCLFQQRASVCVLQPWDMNSGLTRRHGRNGAPIEAVWSLLWGFEKRLTRGGTCLSGVASSPQLFASHTVISSDTWLNGATSQGRVSGPGSSTQKAAEVTDR